MPIYEYRCSACGSEHEVLQKISEPPLSTCPSCKADALTKLVSAAGFQLKGSGWYATDFRNGSKPASKTADKADAKTDGAAKTNGASGESTSSSSESSSSETKTATSAGACGTGCGCH